MRIAGIYDSPCALPVPAAEGLVDCTFRGASRAT
jgi:hypothetical protein